jgi:Flp pilus assembly protein TadD
MKKLLLCAFIALIISVSTAIAQVGGDTIEYEIQGKITFKSGSVVKMQMLKGDEMPATAQHGEMSKHFDTELFGGKVTGWLAIGDLQVTAIAGDIITFSLLKELSVVTENGIKKEHFVTGKEVKFVWKRVVSADEAAYKKGQDIVDTDMDKALQYYKQAAHINPLHDKALNMIGMVMNQKGQKDSSLLYFKRASDIDPKNAQYAKNVCITIYATGELEQGYAYAKKAVENDKFDAEAWYLRGLMYYLIKKDTVNADDKKIVLADLDKSVVLASGESFYLGERAFIRSQFGDMTGACEDAKKAKQLGAENGDELIKTYCPQ